MTGKLLLLISYLVGLCGVACGLSASFYGDSYIYLPLDDASSETDIKLHFRTYRTEGLLFLAAGTTDYCVVELRGGMVRVRMDLGSGEAGLGSPPGVVFSDMQWHFVHLVRSQEQVQLNIDNLYQTATTTPGQFYELNINNGIYVGSLENFSDRVFFGHSKEYRGCLQDILFNSVGVFNSAKQLADPLKVFGVTWDCSPEFGATSTQPISFLQNTSFIAFPPIETRNEGRITFDIRTRSENALLLYNSGRLHSSDFIAVEVLGGHVKLTLNKGSGTVELLSKKSIDDGDWHQVEIVVDQASIRISVDGRRKERRTSFGNNRLLDLYAYLYLGGIGVIARAQVVHKMLGSLSGTNAAAGSLIGCIQNFKVNGQLLGFRQAQMTRGLHPECLWNYPCFSDPCVHNSTCVEEGFYYYRCVCDRVNCFKTGATGNSSSAAISDIIHVQDLIVREGARSLISRTNIDLLLDYKRHNIRESSIAFKVISAPQHGTLIVDVDRRSSDQKVFTVMDLHGNKISYQHDDSESRTDSLGLELEFLSADDTLPDVFKQKYNFTLVVQIAAWNDKPVISLPEENTLVLVANTQIRVTPKIMNVMDKDDRPRDLEYTVQYQQGYDIGYFEIMETLGIRARITSFTQADINEGRIKYTHRGEVKQQIRLQVSDGKDISDPVNLIIESIPLRLELVTKTGLKIPSGVTALLLRDNMTFSVSDPSNQIDIRYEITDSPYFGSIQRQQYADNQWITVTSFLQEDIDSSRIRYVHNGGYHPQGDYFLFRVKAMDVTTDEYEFVVKIMKTEAVLETNVVLQMDGVKEKTITQENLKASSTVEKHTPSNIYYALEEPPANGNLLRLDPNDSRQNKQRIASKSNFTQEEINAELVVYRLHKALFAPIHDEFRFRVVIPGNSSAIYTFDINYDPIDTDMRFVNNGLMNVIEGKSKLITRDDLYMATENIDNFRFTVISGPAHGVLELRDVVTSQPIASNISAFTTNQIGQNELYYRHDDSEHAEDSFNFIATPIVHQSGFMIQEISEFTGTFEVKILLHNDNTPQRVIEKVFYVVANSGRVITPNDIKYIDPDVDFNSSMLIMRCRNIPNGEIVYTKNRSSLVSQFTQADIDAGNLYFKHHGAAYGKSVIWVTDGEHYNTGLWEIQASEPYVRILDNTGISVQKGREVVISYGNLSIESNIDAKDKDVKISVTSPPSHGTLKKLGADKSRFNLGDLKMGHVAYVHDNSDELTDSFSYVVRIEDTEVRAQMRVHIVMDTQQHPPRIIHNKVKVVDERTKVAISQEELEVGHPETAPRDIQYTIKSHPRFGYLSMRGGREGHDLRKFTQDDINRGKVKYTHQEKGAETDIFTFDVTNGIASLQGLEFVFEIAPIVIPLEGARFTLVEGERKVLSADIILIPNKHFASENLQYIILKQPMNGLIEDVDTSQVPLSWFTQQSLNNGHVYYVHSGNESLSDEFTIMAKSKTAKKHSNPFTFTVTIIPTNDQPPVVVNNNRLDVWTGSVTVITKDYLETQDLDTPPSGLMYIISTPSNGYVALKDNHRQNIVNFTQEMINEGQVVFVHNGNQGSANRGRLEFRVTDGENYERSRTFHVLSKALVLTLKTHSALEVYPQIAQSLTDAHLLTVTNDPNQSRPVIYTVQQKPQHGLLVKNINDSLVEVTSFSQADVTDGMIAYQHTSEMTTWTQADEFVYEVSTAFAKHIKMKTFQVSISYVNINEENKHQLLHMSLVFVNEGGKLTIDRDDLNIAKLRKKLQSSGLDNPEVSYVVKNPPSHGWLQVIGENATEGTSFEQRDINKGGLVYLHDHSDSSWDVFEFYVRVQTSGAVSRDEGTQQPRLPVSLNITILQVNDRRFQFMEDYPNIDLVQGFMANITKAELHTTDPDTPPNGILYEIINPPINGILVHVDDSDEPIDAFTQQDINENKIMFIHDGSMESGAFYFRVSDGQFDPYYKVFSLNVYPLTLDVRRIRDLSITQGFVSVVLAPNNIEVETNGNRMHILYNVTKQPTFGQLYLHDSPVLQFSQKHIEMGDILYVQTDLRSHEDSFEFIVYDMQNFLSHQRMHIRVIAQLKQSKEPVKVPPGQPVTLTLDALDASELAKTTNSVPVYIITNHPKLGHLVKETRVRKVHRQKRGALEDSMQDEPARPFIMEDEYEMRNVPIYNFTHQDLLDRTIRYKPSPSNITSAQPDNIGFVLTAENAQPAPGKLELMVEPLEHRVASTKAPGGGDSPSTPPKEGDTKVKPKPSSDPNSVESARPGDKGGVGGNHLRVVFIVCGLTVLVVIIFIVVKCVKRQRRKKKEYKLAMAQMEGQDKTPASHPGYYSEKHPDSASDEMDKDSDLRSECSSSIPVASHAGGDVDEIQYRSPTAIYKVPDYPEQSEGGKPTPGTSRPRPKSMDLSRTPPRSPDLMRAEFSRTVPMCKVTPLVDPDEETDVKTPFGSLKMSSTDQVTFDWEHVDPELLQHCRKTNPVLHQNKYWV